MTKSELTDNLCYLAAAQTLKRLTGDGVLSEAEARTAEENLKRKLHPTI